MKKSVIKTELTINNKAVGYYNLHSNWVQVFNLRGNCIFEKNGDYLESYLIKSKRKSLENYLVLFLR